MLQGVRWRMVKQDAPTCSSDASACTRTCAVAVRAHYTCIHISYCLTPTHTAILRKVGKETAACGQREALSDLQVGQAPPHPPCLPIQAPVPFLRVSGRELSNMKQAEPGMVHTFNSSVQDVEADLSLSLPPACRGSSKPARSLQ